MLSKEEVLLFCNEVRRVGGTDILPELLPSDVSVGTSCLIANALNFNCEISPYHSGDEFDSWFISISDYDVAKSLADSGLLKPQESPLNPDEPVFLFDLPPELAEVANAFDEIQYPDGEFKPLNEIPIHRQWLTEYANGYSSFLEDERVR